MFGYEGLSKVTRAGSLRGILRILKIMYLIDIHLSAHMDLQPTVHQLSGTRISSS